jgi:hypothetical protein
MLRPDANSQQPAVLHIVLKGVISMDMREYEYNLHHRADDLRREMEHQRLIEAFTEKHPSLVGRLWKLVRHAAPKQTTMAAVQPEASSKPITKHSAKPAATMSPSPCHPRPEHA